MDTDPWYCQSDLLDSQSSQSLSAVCGSCQSNVRSTGQLTVYKGVKLHHMQHNQLQNLLIAGMPTRSKDVDRFRETIIVDKSCVDREEPHHSDDVATPNKHAHYLKTSHFNQSAPIFCILYMDFILYLFVYLNICRTLSNSFFSSIFPLL